MERNWTFSITFSRWERRSVRVVVRKMKLSLESNINPFYSSRSDATLVDTGQLAYRQFNTEASRKQTYVHWPSETGVSLDTLAAAGFFYIGVSDWVKCFHCGGGLFCWRQGDDPIADHARYYPWCPFIRTKKGEGTTSTIITKPWSDNDPPSAAIRPVALTEEEANLLLAHPVAEVNSSLMLVSFS